MAAEIDSLEARLAREPAPVVVTHPVTGRSERVLYSRGALGETVRAAMYSPLGAAALPLEIHEAYRHDYGALATSHLRRQWTIASEGWAGLYLAATCPEDIARLDAARAIARNEGTILSASRVRQHVTACQGWPARDARDTWPEKSTVAAPVLMIVGERDPVTPPRWAEMAREHAANSALVVVPYGGHGFAGLRGLDCITRIKLSFYDNPDPAGVDTSCLTDIVRPPFIVTR
jgi:pimeloyl-ACP methyl ester carboxylesterase